MHKRAVPDPRYVKLWSSGRRELLLDNMRSDDPEAFRIFVAACSAAIQHEFEHLPEGHGLSPEEFASGMMEMIRQGSLVLSMTEDESGDGCWYRLERTRHAPME